MTDADFLRDMSVFFYNIDMREEGARLRAIALEHERMERELTRIMQEGREASAAMGELKG